MELSKNENIKIIGLNYKDNLNNAKNFINELRWRGMLQDIVPGCEKKLLEESVSGYIGFDPTADSLHIGSLVQILI